MIIKSDFECVNCEHIFEEYLIDTRYDQHRPCPKCKNPAKRILTFRGGYRANPTWLPSALELLQADDERPIESRSDHDRYLKEHDISHRC